MKYRYWGALVILIVVSVFVIKGIIFFNQNVYPIWNANEFKISVVQPLDIKKVKIYFGISVNTINRDNDLDLFADMDKYEILFDGEKKADMINEYGENDFLITYDSKYYFSFRQFKLSPRNQHIYNIQLVEDSGEIVLKMNIEGVDEMKFTKTMIPIEYAEHYRCNTPINDAGTIYNMIELVIQ